MTTTILVYGATSASMLNSQTLDECDSVAAALSSVNRCDPLTTCGHAYNIFESRPHMAELTDSGWLPKATRKPRAPLTWPCRCSAGLVRCRASAKSCQILTIKSELVKYSNNTNLYAAQQ